MSLQTGPNANGSKGFFDTTGQQTGVKITQKQGIGMLISAIVFAIVYFLPFGLQWGAQLTLALTALSIVLFMTEALPMILTTFILGILTIITGLIPINTFLASFGTSPFLMIMGLLVVAMGMSKTTLAARTTYTIIKIVGTSHSALLFAVFASVTFISVFLADIPSVTIMLPVALGILKELGEEPGKSKLGRAMMICLTWGSFLGGLGLMSGSGINITGITILEKATKGAFTVSYLQWAAIGIPFVLIMLVPVWWIINKYFGVGKSVNTSKLTKEDFIEKLEHLGPLNAPEKRFIATVLLMVTLFICGSWIPIFSIPLVAIISMVITVAPYTGTVNWRHAQKELPWDMLLLIGVILAFSGAIISTGLGSWLVKSGLGWTAGYPIWALILITAILGGLSHFVFIANPNGAVAVLVAGVVPLAASMHINPGILVIPALFVGTVALVQPIGPSFMITKASGYFEFREVPIPALIILIPWVIVITIITLIVGPMVGLL